MTGAATRSTLRQLIRAQRRAFAGDAEMLRSGHAAILQQFRANRDAAADKVPAMLKTADEAIDFLRHNIVQAPLNERGNYQVDATRIDESHAK